MAPILRQAVDDEAWADGQRFDGVVVTVKDAAQRDEVVKSQGWYDGKRRVELPVVKGRVMMEGAKEVKDEEAWVFVVDELTKRDVERDAGTPREVGAT